MVRRTFIALVAAGLAVDVHASGFFVCPGQCEAKFLPRDMDDVDDCSCYSKNDQPSRVLLSQSFGDDSSSVYRCPKGASAKALHPKSFDDCLCSDNLHRDEKTGLCVTEITCSGKYALKSGLTSARSLADCDCLDPYTKDESTGECQLTFCPRAANYVKKPSVTQVHSLVDCDCLDPYTKNAQSGECYIRFVCPAHSSPPVQGFAKSIADCTCDWGFVRPQVKSTSSSSSDPYCVAEKPTFACPPHSRPLPTLEGSPQNFMDCECANGYDRLEKLEVCTESPVSSSLRGSNETSAPATVEPFECPDFSMPIAPHPYSMNQCSCLPGFEPNLSLQSCDWTPDYYVCPPHSFNPYPALPPLGFADCHCAKGFQRNDGAGVCVEKDVMGENGCPTGALAKTWPVHDPNYDCFCPHGDSEPDGGDLGAIATSEFMAHLENQVPLESDWSLRCKNSAVVGFFGCPPHAVMNHWPVLVLEDCSCKAGFDSVAAENDLGMACNRTTTDTFPPCTAGMTRSLVDNVCRFPAEQVSTTPRPTSELALSTATSGRIVVNGNELDYVLVEEDIMVTQGDIAVGTSFGFLGDGPDSDLLFYVLHGYYNKEKESRWKDATMCFTIDKQVQHRREHIWSAMNHISVNTGFRFLECKEEYCDDHLNDCDDLVDFSPTASSCWSSVGRVGGRQMLGVSDDCSEGNLIHVLLHAMGLHHPTVRPDRDAHVQIAWECVEAAKRTYLAVEHLEDIYSAEELDIAAVEVPYDYFSIMHHRADAFVNTSMADGGCMSIFPIIQDPYQRQAVMTGMGQREKLSFTDIHYVWVLYPELKEAMAVQAAAASLASSSEDAVDLPPHEYHESRLHTKEDALPYRPASSTSGAVGAVVCVVAVVAIIGFASFEMRRLARKRAETEGSTKFSDPLLSDPIYD